MLIAQVIGKFYRQHLALFLLFLFGLSLGGALLGAIQGLNQEAGERYENTSALLNNPITHFVRPAAGQQYIEQTTWLRLRKAGITSAAPVVEHTITLEGQRFWLRGVNTLDWLSQARPAKQSQQGRDVGFALNTLFLPTALAQRLNINQAVTREIAGVTVNLQPAPSLEGKTALADIALVDSVLKLNGAVSYIEISDPKLDPSQVQLLLNGEGVLQNAEQQSFDSLSKAFFFNLKALALLGYVVGAFLSFNAIKLVLYARKKLHSQLLLFGCTERTLAYVVASELLFMSAIAALIGEGMAYFGANLLLGEINLAMQSLFELDRSLAIEFSWTTVLLAFSLNVMVLLGVIVGQLRGVSIPLNTPIKLSALMMVAVIAGYFYRYSISALDALALCVSLLLLFFIICGPVLRYTFSWLPAASPLLKWMKAQSTQQLAVLKVSVYAVLLATGASVGLQVMVASFNSALQIHLDKRLSADLYVRPDKVTEQQYRWLAARPEVAQLGVYWHAEAALDNAERRQLPPQVEVISFGADATSHQNLQLLQGRAPNSTELYSAKATEQLGCLANEPSQLRYGLETGMSLRLLQGERVLRCTITGFYYDYGEQKPVLVVPTTALQQAGFAYQQYGFSIQAKLGADIDQLKQDIVTALQLKASQVSYNQVFKDFANMLFSHTFYATKALNMLIVLIALFGLWVSLLTLGAKQLQPLVTLSTLGVTTKQLLAVKLLQSGIILLVTLLLATALGFALGVVLLKLVMPIGFGWSIPMDMPIVDISFFLLTIFILALVVSLLPLLKLRRYAAADLLYEQ